MVLLLPDAAGYDNADVSNAYTRSLSGILIFITLDPAGSFLTLLGLILDNLFGTLNIREQHRTVSFV